MQIGGDALVMMSLCLARVSVFVYIHTCFCFTLIGGNLTAQSMGSKLSFLFPPRHQSALDPILILNLFTTRYSEEKVSRALAVLKMAIFQKFANKGSCFLSLENQQVVLQTLFVCAGKPLHSGDLLLLNCYVCMDIYLHSNMIMIKIWRNL